MKIVGIILGGIALLAVILFFSGFIFGIPIMFLWNWLIPDLFNIGEISYWQAIGLYYLFGLLVRPFNQTEKKN